MFIVESLNYVHTYIECNDGTIFQKRASNPTAKKRGVTLMLTREEAIEILELQQCPHAVPYKDYCSGCCYHILDLLKQQLEQPRRKPVNISSLWITSPTNMFAPYVQHNILYSDGSIDIRIEDGFHKLPPIPQDKQDPRKCEHINLDVISENDLRKVSWCKDCGGRITENIDPNTNNPIPQDDDNASE